MDWLEREKDSGSIVAYAVAKGREAIKKRKVQDKMVEETKIKRMKERYQKKESKERNQVQRKLKVIMSQSTFSKESIRDIHKDVKEETLDLAFKFMNSPVSFTGNKFDHLWFDNEMGTDVHYLGEIMKVSRGGKSLTVEYVMEEDMDNSYNLNTTEFITDLLFGDLTFVSL